ncbi:hypothetical protein [Lentisalinibacter salinarum]|uniref:hypothetical protein n=1 Tax=Lentisalinibacter salinarum TaxID=2992239 RepID=UPI00386BCC85
MKRIIISWALVSLLFASTGCTTMREVRPGERPLREVLRTGDHVIVYEDTGRIVDMRYVWTDGTTLRGSLFADGLTPVEVEIDRIERVEVERIAAGRTGLAVVGGIIMAPIAALGLGMALAEQ